MATLDERLAKFPQKNLTVDNVAISYREAGEGIPLVLLHGIGSGSGSWLFQFESLQQQYHVVAWDAPGYGESTPLDKSIPEVMYYADVLKRLVDGLGLKTFYLVGHSLGALIASAYCYQFSETVLSLVLANPATGYGKDNPEVRDSKNNARIELMERLGPQGLAKERSRKLLSDNAPENAVDLVRWNMSRLHKQGYIQAANMLANSNLCEFCQKISKRVLILYGVHDRITPETMAVKVARCYEQSEYKSIKGAGHASYIEAPEVFNFYIKEFIETQENNVHKSEVVV